MSGMKRWAELVSEAIGHRGEITPKVEELDGLLSKLINAGLIVANPPGVKEVPPIMEVCAPGDRSVGIGPHYVYIVGLPSDHDYREQLRKDFRELFVDILDDGQVRVRYFDECADCGQPIREGKCTNVKCITNASQDDEPDWQPMFDPLILRDDKEDNNK